MAHTTERTTRQRLALGGLALAAALLVASCASPTDNDTRSATAGLPDTLQSLQAQTWVLDTAETTPAIRTTATVTLSFEDERLFGQGPCNTYTARFSVEGDHGLDIGLIASTLKGCDAATAKAEAAYLKALAAVDQADTVDPKRLVLEGDGVSLAYDRLDLDEEIAGTWTIVNLNTGNALATPIEGTEPTITFDPGGKLAASAGCNPIATTWKLDGSVLTIGKTAQAMMACPEPEGVSEQESALTAALANAVRAEVTDQLRVFDEDDRILIVATREPS